MFPFSTTRESLLTIPSWLFAVISKVPVPVITKSSLE